MQVIKARAADNLVLVPSVHNPEAKSNSKIAIESAQLHPRREGETKPSGTQALQILTPLFNFASIKKTIHNLKKSMLPYS